MKVLVIDVQTSEILEIKEVADDYILQPENLTTFEAWSGDSDKVGDIYI
jgi:hypothetical protein